MSKRYGTLADRFHAQYIPEPNSGCWLWTGSYKQRDLLYGRLKLPNSKRTVFAHRVSYELHYGVTLGRSDFVCHHCDNPSCVNPEHLFLGDAKANMDDKTAKGRTARGSSHGMSKITEADVLEIRASQESQKRLAERFGIDQTNVSLIRRGEAWKHVQDA